MIIEMMIDKGSTFEARHSSLKKFVSKFEQEQHAIFTALVTLD